MKVHRETTHHVSDVLDQHLCMLCRLCRVSLHCHTHALECCGYKRLSTCVGSVAVSCLRVLAALDINQSRQLYVDIMLVADHDHDQYVASINWHY